MTRKRRLSTGPKPPKRDDPGRQVRPPSAPPASRRRKVPAKPAPGSDAVQAEMVPELALRVGHGWDLHRLEPIKPAGAGRPMVLGGVPVDAPSCAGRGPVARSDGDVLLHAITDAILGALALPDIGQLFPDTSSANEGRDSAEFLAEAVRRMTGAGYVVGNLDATVICERPKLGPIKERIRLNLARLLGVSPERVNIKGKTHERVDAVGEGRAIEAHAVVTLLLKK
jgi:2-C-methyl-D-erythritol 2,4-cyclodiphosphate synthase